MLTIAKLRHQKTPFFLRAHSMMMASPTSTLLFFFFFLLVSPPLALPLSTNSRWILGDNGERVKLSCANWAAHLETMLPEGLGKQPLGSISGAISSMGFNCVRLTWALYMLTNSSLTARQSLLRLGLPESAAALQVNNPDLVDLPVLGVFQAVVSTLGRNNIMVILDNHISKPGWCCSKFDGNGFFGDEYFDPDEWIEGLKMMGTLFNGSTNVVGMSLRNELRGPKQNVNEWYRYMQRGAEAVHSVNPNVLVILSGLDYDKDLSYLMARQVQLTFTGKLVYELHWYGFSDGGDWLNGNTNTVCGCVVGNVTNKGLYLLERGWPLFLGEFGVDQSGNNIADNRFLSCFMGIAAELDLDWAIWALQGNYYIREGIMGHDESYGLMSWDWCKPRSPKFLHRITSLQSPFRGPGLPHSSEYKILFHPLTGLCVLRNMSNGLLSLGSCLESEAWAYTEGRKLELKSRELCLHSEGLGKPVKLGDFCSYSNSSWDLISDSKMHLATWLSDGMSPVCLDAGADGTILTNSCLCMKGEDGTCDPQSQWFKIVSSIGNQIGGDLVLKSYKNEREGSPLILQQHEKNDAK